jgi:hypothetical protein
MIDELICTGEFGKTIVVFKDYYFGPLISKKNLI